MVRTLLPLALLLHLTIAACSGAPILWRRALPAYDGPVHTLAVDPAGGIHAGTDSGLWRSTNGGDDWTRIDDGLGGNAVRAIAVPSAAVILAGTDAGLWRSTDGGGSWAPANQGLSATRVTSLVVTGLGTVIAGTTGSGAFRSTDQGASWTHHGPDGANISTLHAAPGGLFAGTTLSSAWGIYRSTDDGVTWTPTREGLKTGNIFALAHTSGGEVFAAAFHHVPTNPGIYRSADNGEHWSASGIENTWITSLAVDARDHIFAGQNGGGYGELPTYYGVSRSADNGGTWTPENLGLENRNILSLAVDARSFIFAGTERGLFRTSEATFGVGEESGIKRGEAILRAIDPNPLSTRTTIRLHLPRTARLRVDIHDALGNKVAALWSGTLGSGDHDIVWSAGDRARGVYFCRIAAEDRCEVRKVILAP